MLKKHIFPGIDMDEVITFLIISVISVSLLSCNSRQQDKTEDINSPGTSDKHTEQNDTNKYPPVYALLVSPGNPQPGETFRVLATGDKNLRKATVVVTGPDKSFKSVHKKNGFGPPYWQIDDFAGQTGGAYEVALVIGKMKVCSVEFSISPLKAVPPSGQKWKSLRDWDSGTEDLYTAWISALFDGCDERSTWPALHEVTRNRDRNFLYNHLSLGEDNHEGKNTVILRPDCADNPFFLRAYFSWKLNLPFGYHECDRGYVGHPPGTGNWITNETPAVKGNPVLSFDLFLRRIMNGVHSGTARTALQDENSDYYPVSLEKGSLRPGTVYADPYGHTLVITGWVPQTRRHPGALLSVDAQPDGTVGIKRFWKGNFLFSTTEVVGEPGFKAFRPILIRGQKLEPLTNEILASTPGYVPFSLQQQKMENEVFYHTMERLINPRPLDPKDALLDRIRALHEQLLVRVTSVANGEAFMKSHPGIRIPMPGSTSAIFQSGGQWEDFSTPNRDLRLLIAIDEVLDFPDRLVRTPGDFRISKWTTPEKVKIKLKKQLDKKTAELSVTYIRTDGSEQKLTLAEIITRKEAFEMAYNPNDGIEIRWGAPADSEELKSCRRRAPQDQQMKMESARKWFQKRLHPPT
jgi:hypothetical protein